jgi:hypothetical protein
MVSNNIRLSMASAIVASPQQISCDVADEAVLLSMLSGEYYGLNPVGASIWKLIQEPRTVEDLLAPLMDEYTGVSEEECKAKVLAFVSELISLGLARAL